MAVLEQVTDALCYHGEGPVWSPTWGGLRWVDLLAGDVLTLRADGSVDRLHVGDVAAFVRPRTRGGWVVAPSEGSRCADEPDGIPAPWIELWDDPVDPDERGRRRQPGPPLVRVDGLRPRARQRDPPTRRRRRRRRHGAARRDDLQRHRPLARRSARLLQRHAERAHRRLRRRGRRADPPPPVRHHDDRRTPTASPSTAPATCGSRSTERGGVRCYSPERGGARARSSCPSGS